MAEIRHLIPIEAPPEQVYAALATQAGLHSWWTADTTADDKAGGKAEFGFEKRGMTFRMTIEKRRESVAGTEPATVIASASEAIHGRRIPQFGLLRRCAPRNDEN